MMTKNGIPKLIDFGLARRTREYTVSQFKTTNYHELKGTVNWMAPELAGIITEDDKDKEIISTKQSDKWSYGMVVLVSFD